MSRYDQQLHTHVKELIASSSTDGRINQMFIAHHHPQSVKPFLAAEAATTQPEAFSHMLAHRLLLSPDSISIPEQHSTVRGISCSTPLDRVKQLIGDLVSAKSTVTVRADVTVDNEFYHLVVPKQPKALHILIMLTSYGHGSTAQQHQDWLDSKEKEAADKHAPIMQRCNGTLIPIIIGANGRCNTKAANFLISLAGDAAPHLFTQLHLCALERKAVTRIQA